mgnify:CR=1 FL=1
MDFLFVLDAFATAHFEPRTRGEPDEGVAAEALAADHGFEQIGVRPVGELEIDRQRRVEIGESLEHQRNAVMARCRQLVELLFVHDCAPQ